MIEMKCDVRGCGKRAALAEDKASLFGAGFPLPEGWRMVQSTETLARPTSPMAVFKTMLPPETQDAIDSAEELFPTPKKMITKHICPEHDLPDTTGLDS
jgi:hypothetical protein